MKRKELIGNIVWFVSLIAILFFLRTFVFTPVIVSGHSMDPTLQDRQRVFAFKNTKIERFDIVTFPAPDEPEKQYIKRVIGLPGDEIRYAGDVLYVNGESVPEPYLAEFKAALPQGDYLTELNFNDGITLSEFDLADFTTENKVPEGMLFVLGDNRQNSRDSRMIGFIPLTDVSGDVKISFWPPSKIGRVK